MDEQRKLIAATSRLDVAFRTGTVQEAIAAERKAVMDELAGRDREEVARTEDRGTG